MKKSLLFSLNIYQQILSPCLKSFLGVSSFCRFSPTCSEYARKEIQEKGALAGGLLALRRISSCHPFNKK